MTSHRFSGSRDSISSLGALPYILVFLFALLLFVIAFLIIPDKSSQRTPSASSEGSKTTGTEKRISSETEQSTSETEQSTSEKPSGETTVSSSGTSKETAPKSSSAVSSETGTAPSEASCTLSDVVFIGDSRTLSMASGGSWEYRLVPDGSVAATWGGQLTDDSALENARLAAAKKRKIAVFWYGINDVQVNPDRDNAEAFIRNYIDVLNTYLENFSGSEIYIVSVLTTSVNEKDYYEGQNENIARYNSALEKLCKDCDYHYLDASFLYTGEDCFAEGDNIHFSKAWYENSYLPWIKKEIGIR